MAWGEPSNPTTTPGFLCSDDDGILMPKTSMTRIVIASMVDHGVIPRITTTMGCVRLVGQPLHIGHRRHVSAPGSGVHRMPVFWYCVPASVCVATLPVRHRRHVF